MGKKLSNFIKKENIVFLDTNDMEETVEILVENAYNSGIIKDKKMFINAVLEREELVSTGIGLGVALPHAKLLEIEDFFMY